MVTTIDFQSPISCIMEKKFYSLHPKDKIQVALEIFNTNRIDHILIILSTKLVGIVTRGDIAKMEAKRLKNKNRNFIMKDFNLIPVDEVMNAPVLTVKHDSSIRQVIKKLLVYNINCLPVLEHGELSGIITRKHILKQLYESY
jgi:CBS domain-containing protein